MQLTDALSPRDKETITHYIQLYAGVAEPAPIDIVLKAWNKNKRTMYKALGHKLRVKIPIEIPRNDSYFKQELESLYHPIPIWDKHDAEWFLRSLKTSERDTRDPFVFEYLKYISCQSWCDDDLFHASRLLLHQNLESGYLSSVAHGRMGEDLPNGYHFQNFNATVKSGMKTIRTIQKVLKAMRFPYMELFEEWRNKVNSLSLNQGIKANLVFSIHPLDFMTMSDNACNWTSCMSWTANGSYSSGTIEMMNSNMTILAYLENKTPFNIIFDEQEYNIPNKSWRTLLYVHKDILIGGKAYPYFNQDLIIKCLDIMRGLLKENLAWDYQYINQPYLDNKSIRNNHYLKHNDIYTFNRPKQKNKKKHAIYLYTNGMYNDIIEYKDDFICCRNYVPKTIKLCASGPATCMCCGEQIEDPHYISSYDDIGSEKICSTCRSERACSICGEIKYSSVKYTYTNKRFGRTRKVCSEKCLEELIYVPNQDEFVKKEDAFFEGYFVIGKLSNFLKSIEVKIFVTEHHGWYYRGQDKIIEDLMNNSFIKENAIIVKVPYWIFDDSTYFYTYSPIEGYVRRAGCRNVKFFNIEETFGGQNILQSISENKKWIPAKEVI